MDNKLIKVMIVDDESLIRIGLKSTIDWQKYNMKVICEAASGDAAYEMFLEQQPDLVFTDIRMPKKDGIWLTRMIRQRDNETPIIVLTCYDEFSYVREALRAGANEYMLKSEVEQEKMDLILNEMMLLCNTLKHRKNGKIGLAENVASFRRGSVKAELTTDGSEPAYELNDDEMFELIFTEEATEEIKREIWSNRFNQISDRDLFIYALMLNDESMITSQIKTFARMDQALIEIINQIFRNEGLDALLTGSSLSLEMVINCRERGAVELGKIFAIIQTAVQRYCNLSMSVVHTNLFYQLSDLSAANYDVRSQADRLFYEPAKTVLPVAPGYSTEPDNEALKWQKSIQLQIIQMVHNERPAELLAALNETAANFSQKHVNSHEVKLFYSQLASKLILDFSPCMSEDSRENYQNHYEMIMSSNRLTAVLSYLQKLCDDILREVSQYSLAHSHDYTQKIIKFVEQRYQQKITLADIADHVNLSKNYVSVLFKKETGQGIASYINEVRIKAAQQMIIQQGASVKDIYDQVGFSDEQYFCRMFKKITGQTVSQYKDRGNDSEK